MKATKVTTGYVSSPLRRLTGWDVFPIASRDYEDGLRVTIDGDYRNAETTYITVWNARKGTDYGYYATKDVDAFSIARAVAAFRRGARTRKLTQIVA